MRLVGTAYPAGFRYEVRSQRQEESDREDRDQQIAKATHNVVASTTPTVAPIFPNDIRSWAQAGGDPRNVLLDRQPAQWPAQSHGSAGSLNPLSNARWSKTWRSHVIGGRESPKAFGWPGCSSEPGVCPFHGAHKDRSERPKREAKKKSSLKPRLPYVLVQPNAGIVPATISTAGAIKIRTHR